MNIFIYRGKKSSECSVYGVSVKVRMLLGSKRQTFANLDSLPDLDAASVGVC